MAGESQFVIVVGCRGVSSLVRWQLSPWERWCRPNSDAVHVSAAAVRISFIGTILPGFGASERYEFVVSKEQTTKIAQKKMYCPMANTTCSPACNLYYAYMRFEWVKEWLAPCTKAEILFLVLQQPMPQPMPRYLSFGTRFTFVKSHYSRLIKCGNYDDKNDEMANGTSQIRTQEQLWWFRQNTPLCRWQ